ncbi:RHS repeat-associated core domain-containing protein [Hahella sp. HN01]|uniref:RHS repeat-associated core domain-containing protein n=1 Tax=Hahella sp. HN01 TaxID=2847262 RepID=UPI001C1F12C9|nr:RHS repeat-associated core domain-containing protein [Hahella sp. HN01]MBU6951964.1 RHS repeat protein [Hahella sp. HN01]
MYSTRSYAFKHWSDITVADLPFIESPFFAASFADRCLSNDFKVSDVASNLCGYHFRSGFGAFPGRGSPHFRKWKDDFVRGVERGEVLLIFTDKKKPFCPVINESEEGPVPVSSEVRLAERLIARANPAPPPPPAVTGEVMEVTQLAGNPGWSSEKRASSSHQASAAAAPAAAPSSAPAQAKGPDEEAQAQTLKNTAQEGLPFCEECEKAAAPANAPKSEDTPATSNKTGVNDNGETSQDNVNSCKNGHPISMVTGEELLDQLDFKLSGPLPLIWKRTYKSSNHNQRGLGHGWTHFLSQQLEEVDGRIVFTTDEGRYIDFPLPSEGEMVRNSAEHFELHRLGERHFVLKQLGKPNLAFSGKNGVYRLESVLDSLGNRIDVSYWVELEEHERPVTIVTTSGGKRLHLLHNAYGLICEVQNVHDDGRVDSLVKYQYDEAQDLIAVTDPAGNSETFGYRNHVITRHTLKTGFSVYFEWNRYDKSARCLRQWCDNGIYDYRFEWDLKNRISQATDSNGGVTTYHYNERGQVAKEIDPEGGVTRRAYDAAGNLIEETNPNGHSTHYGYNDQGKLTTLVDANGGIYKIDYNADAQPISITNALGHKWTREYDSRGLVTAFIDPAGNKTQYEYNSQGRLNKVTDAVGNQKEYRWNHQGQLVSETNNNQTTTYAYNESGAISKASTSKGGVSRFKYDLNGNITEVVYPDGSKTQLRYNANDQLTHVIDGAGRCTEYVYDGLSQVRKKIDPSGKVFEYQYDKERNLVGLINEKGERYELAYDRNERLIREVGFDGRVQQYQYDPAGYLKAHIEGLHTDEVAQAEHTTFFKRDRIGRLLEKHSPDGEVSRFGYNASGQVIKAVNSNRSIQFAYNRLGQLAEERQDHHVLRHEYDALGNRTQTTLPDGRTLEFAYASNGLFNQASVNGATLAKVQRDEYGRETRRLQGSVESHYEYDLMGRLVRHHASNRQTKERIIERDYGYDLSGNLALIEDFKKGATHYHYDALDRLKAVESFCNEEFSFDPAGNILDGANQAKGNRLNFHGDRHFEYDEAGNLIREKRGKGGKLETRYFYNKQNQLVAVEKDGQRTEYKYDALGRRVSKQDAFGKTVFLWNGDVLLSEQRKHLSKIYVYEPNSFRPLAFIQDQKVYHYHLDHLGTPQEMTDAKGKIVWSVRYKAYGNLALKETEEVENSLRFQGQYFDDETGLHYNRHRYYDPGSARFINQDPVGLVGGANNYLYVPNPTHWVDPFGLTAKPGDCPDVIPDNYDIMEDRFKNAILVLQPKDGIVAWSAQKLVDTRNVPIIGRDNIDSLRNVKKLTLLAHGTGDAIAGHDGVTLGNKLKEIGFKPDEIEVIACRRTPGPARQDIANIMGVPVTGGTGRMKLDNNGDVRVLDEQKVVQRTEAKGSPLTNEELNSCLRPVGEGFETFTPNGSCSTVA